MKNKGLVILMLSLILLICPLAAMNKNSVEQETATAQAQSDRPSKDKKDSIIVFSPQNKKIENIDMFEYTVGAVAAEIAPTYHSEAIKAQAIAAYTYALKAKGEGKQSELGGAHISTSSEKHQGYISLKERKELWGDKFETYENKIEAAVKEVYGKKITYNGELIDAVYHAISCGNTFDSSEVWGTQTPYLRSVVSAGDRLSPDYTVTQVYSVHEMKEGLNKIKGLKLTEDESKWIGKTKYTDSGYTEYIEICQKQISGKDLRQALGLKSACISIEYIDKSFKIKTKGNGHGVGMSQYGADYMARQGKSCEDILKHYYSGVKIE